MDAFVIPCCDDNVIVLWVDVGWGCIEAVFTHLNTAFTQLVVGGSKLFCHKVSEGGGVRLIWVLYMSYEDRLILLLENWKKNMTNCE